MKLWHNVSDGAKSRPKTTPELGRLVPCDLVSRAWIVYSKACICIALLFSVSLAGCGELKRLITLGPETTSPANAVTATISELALAVTGGSLSWSAYERDDFAGYEIRIAADPAQLDSVAPVFMTASPDLTHCTFSGLHPETVYYVQLRILRLFNAPLLSNVLSSATQRIAWQRFSYSQVQVIQNHAYILAQEKGVNQPGILTVSLADPVHPLLESFTTLNALATRMTSAGSTLYLTTFQRLLTCTVTPTPVISTAYTLNASLVDLVVTQNQVIGAGAGQGLLLYTLSNGVLTKTGEYATAGNFASVSLAGARISVCNSSYGAQLFTLAPMSQVTLNASLDLKDRYSAVAMAGNRLYTLNATMGLIVWDISNPDTPVKSGSVAAGAIRPIRFLVSSGRAFCATSSGVLVFDVSDPQHPALQSTIVCQPLDIALSGTDLVVLDSVEGIRYVDY